MNFQFKINVTKDLILSRYSEEQIMSFYLHVPIKKGLIRSPLRNDKEPTCSFYRNNRGELIFKDFATGQHLNCWAVVQTLFNCSYHKALEIIANDLGIVRMEEIPKNKGKIIPCERIEEKEFSKIQVEIQPFSEQELKWWYNYGITEKILKRFEVYSCKHVFLNGQVVAQSQQHCPIFGYYGKKYHGEELWRCYFPKRKSMRFLSNYPAKKLQAYDKLPKSGKLVVITKSLKDCMCLYSMGIDACAPCSENIIPDETIINDLKKRFKYVVALWDNDLPGIVNLNKMHKKYSDIHCTFIPRKYGAKDISDFYAKYGRKKTEFLIRDYLLWIKLQEDKSIT